MILDPLETILSMSFLATEEPTDTTLMSPMNAKFSIFATPSPMPMVKRRCSIGASFARHRPSLIRQDNFFKKGMPPDGILLLDTGILAALDHGVGSAQVL